MSSPALHLGVDIGGTNLRLALYDVASATILRSLRRELGDKSIGGVIEEIASMLDELNPESRPQRIGVALAAQIDSQNSRVVHAPNLNWRDCDFASLLCERLGSPVSLINDVNAIALAESRLGSAAGCADVLCIFVGTGVGMGAIVGDVLLTGHSGLASELGHGKIISPSDPAARLCGCGDRGCVEAYTSGAHLDERYRELAEALAGEIDGSTRPFTASIIEARFNSGDKVAQALWRENAESLGRIVAACVVTLNPERIVLGGGVLGSAGALCELLEKEIRLHLPKAHRLELSIVNSTLGDDAGVLGACLASAL